MTDVKKGMAKRWSKNEISVVLNDLVSYSVSVMI
jgi:hypothetical protein